MPPGILNLWSFLTPCPQVTWRGTCAVNFSLLTWAKSTLMHYISITVHDRRIVIIWPPIKYRTWRVEWSRDRWRHVTQMVKVATPISFRLHICITMQDRRIVILWPPITYRTWRVEWSRDRWRHVTQMVKVATPISFRLHICITMQDRRVVIIDQLWKRLHGNVLMK